MNKEYNKTPRTQAQKNAEHSRCEELNIRTRRILRRGESFRRITHIGLVGNKEYSYHVTKGWRIKSMEGWQ